MPSMTGSPCDKCQCLNGSVMCERMSCPACIGPILHGQCCPNCSAGTGMGN
ncbi:hypothetical protein DPMN_001943 [Dreissena polymorpha]|uniref:Uncharacterized protein n=1 Tax=Dreissena polymorpha TaxID=45954 RepID=A0A9D4MI72_DREPO|nr:hypothetical protein DPMN_001943 [Dreissena polymorpha]